METTFIATRSSVNKMLSIIKKIDHKKSYEEKILYLVCCQIKANQNPSSLHDVIRHFEKGKLSAKFWILGSPQYQEAISFWTREKIIVFQNSRSFFYSIRRDTIVGGLDSYHNEKEVDIYATNQEISDILQWFSCYFPIKKEEQKNEKKCTTVGESPLTKTPGETFLEFFKTVDNTSQIHIKAQNL